MPNITHNDSFNEFARYNFSHAWLASATVGPRRELMLSLQTLHFNGSTGNYSRPVFARFGGVTNMAEVRAFFADSPHPQSELADLRYCLEAVSKPGKLCFEMLFERIEARLVIQCSRITISSEAERELD